jgi:hypothetical protein
LIFAVRVYRWTLSPAKTFLFGPLAGCRYTPSCSQYAQEAIRQHGAAHGGWLAAKRVCRCHPWGTQGFDPVPDISQARHPFAPWRYGRWRPDIPSGQSAED